MTFSIKKQFVSLEAILNCSLPSDYRNFLLTYNGGEPAKPVFRIPGVGSSYSDSAVRYFFSISERSSFSLKYKHDIYSRSGRIAPGMLPIAIDAGGNLILLAIAGNQVGKIFFWDHEVEGLAENSASTQHLTLLANSFEDFCDGLLPFS